jgi:hypothetical protein
MLCWIIRIKGEIFLLYSEVVLGPKNRNAELNIELFLNATGLKGVRIRRSQAPYR